MANSKHGKVLEKPGNEINVAGTLKIKHWENLKDKLDVEKNDCWDKAFKFFEIRINTRYLEPIKRIQTMNRNHGEGFAMVNLQCSLIETIESFYNGWVYHHKKDKSDKYETGFYFREIDGNPIFRENWKIFKKFFDNRINIEKTQKKILKKHFYSNVRCGMLHETQTKGGWVILAENYNQSSFFEEKKKIFYRNNFQKALKDLIRQYKSAIVNGQEFGEIPVMELRENFKAKFNHICKMSRT